MTYIAIIADLGEIYSTRLIELFDAKVHHLSKAIKDFDKIQVNATITVTGIEYSNMLYTLVDVACEDEQFKKLLEQVTERYDDAPSVLN